MSKKKKFDYFKSYEKQAQIAVAEAKLLIKACEDFTSADELTDKMTEMHTLENKADDINHEIYHSAAVDFMPPFDREDVVELAHALDNVVDYIDDVLGHMYVYAIKFMPADALEFVKLILKSCEALDDMMGEFHDFKKSKKFKESIVRINSYEEEADRLYQRVMHRLHTENSDDVLRVLVWSRLYEHMEKCCDATEHASNIISTIMIKNV